MYTYVYTFMQYMYNVRKGAIEAALQMCTFRHVWQCLCNKHVHFVILYLILSNTVYVYIIYISSAWYDPTVWCSATQNS